MRGSCSSTQTTRRVRFVPALVLAAVAAAAAAAAVPAASGVPSYSTAVHYADTSYTYSSPTHGEGKSAAAAAADTCPAAPPAAAADLLTVLFSSSSHSSSSSASHQSRASDSDQAAAKRLQQQQQQLQGLPRQQQQSAKEQQQQSAKEQQQQSANQQQQQSATQQQQRSVKQQQQQSVKQQEQQSVKQQQQQSARQQQQQSVKQQQQQSVKQQQQQSVKQQQQQSVKQQQQQSVKQQQRRRLTHSRKKQRSPQAEAHRRRSPQAQQQRVQQQRQRQQQRQTRQMQQQQQQLHEKSASFIPLGRASSCTADASCWRPTEEFAAATAGVDDDIWKEDQALQNVSNDNFDALLQQHELLLLLLYLPWKRDWKAALPEIFDAATRLRRLPSSSRVSLFAAKVNADAEDSLVKRLGLSHGYPSLKLVRRGSAVEERGHLQQLFFFTSLDYAGPLQSEPILRWILRKQNRLPVVLEEISAVERFLFDHPLAALGVFSEGSAAEAIFLQAARQIRGVTVALSHDLAVGARFGLRETGVVLFLPHEPKRVLYAQQRGVTAKHYAEFIRENQFPLLVPFSATTSQELFQDGRPLLFLLRRTDAEGMQAEATVREVARRYRKEMLMTYVEENSPLMRRLQTFLFVERTALPTVVIVENAASQISALRFLCSESLTHASLSRFIDRYLKFELKPIRRSSSLSSLPQQQQDAVVRDLVAANFEEEVLRSKVEVLLFVYVPWCAHSAKFRLVFEEVAQHLGRIEGLLLGQLDGSVNDIEGVNVLSYSTLLDLRRKAGPHARHGDGVLLPRLGINEDPQKVSDERETALSDLLAADGYPSLLFFSSPDEKKVKKVILYDGVRDVPSVLDFLVLHSHRVAEQRLGGL